MPTLTGHAYYDLGQWEESVSAFEKVVELNPKDKQAFTMLVTAHEKLRAQQKTSSGVGTAPAEDGNSHPTPTKPRSISLLELYKVGTGDVLDGSRRAIRSGEAAFTVGRPFESALLINP